MPEKLSRRAFCGRVATTLALPGFIPGRARGGDNVPAPSERITMGFIGLGGQGMGHLGGGAWTYLPGGYLANPAVQVLAVCDVWQGKRETARDRVNRFYRERSGRDYRACQAYTDFRDVLARDDIDAILIATPIHWHAIMTIMAAESGKDVYCEKPTGLTLAESRAAADTVNRHARVYQGGTQQRSEYGGKFRRAVELIRNGRIGRVTEVYACRPGGAFHADGGVTLAPQPVPKDLDWDLFLGPAPWRPFGGHSGAHMFGDGGINWGQHHYDIVQWALDADRTGPVEIGHEDGHTVYRYDGGVTVHGCPCPGETVGMSGGACFIGTEGRIAVDRENLVAEPAERLDEPLGPEATRLPRLDGHSANFLDCIRTRKKTIVDAETAHRAVSVVLLGGLAQQLGRRLQWNPAKESFIDDPQANRLRSYAPREPWRT